MDRVSQIIEHEKLADDLEAAAEEHRWEAARLISEELAEGKSQRQLASEIDKSKTHVQLMARTWVVFGHLGDRPPFNKAYHAPEVRESPKDDQWWEWFRTQIRELNEMEERAATMAIEILAGIAVSNYTLEELAAAAGRSPEEVRELLLNHKTEKLG